jgi:DNA-binding transcriptional MerR regulator
MTVAPAPPWLTPTALAQRLDVPLSTLYYWRSRGIGPPATVLGGRLRYFSPDVLAWEAEARASSST